MSRIRSIRTLTLAALLFALIVPMAPMQAHAQEPAFVLTIQKLITTVTVVGAGETEAEAIDNAYDLLHASYFVLSSTVVNSFCSTDDPPGPIGPITLCAAEVEARVLRKAVLFPR
jgi:hypothetical protein